MSLFPKAHQALSHSRHAPGLADSAIFRYKPCTHFVLGCLFGRRASFVPALRMASQLTLVFASLILLKWGRGVIGTRGHCRGWGCGSVSRNVNGDFSCPRIPVKGQILEKKQKAVLGTPHPKGSQRGQALWFGGSHSSARLTRTCPSLGR